ncbi:MAG TPA: hypothetical protein VM582_03725 [Candidatus Thermoplasmatota archaeon]|nr:hypothetical protein [Candidatus Thermoplasmatota archaeon]
MKRALVLVASVSLAKKLNIKPGTKLRVVGRPRSVELGDVETTTSPKAEAVLVFVGRLAEVDAKAKPMIEAARADRLAWIAYPKARQLDTDLDRDVLWKHLLAKHKIQGVRQVAIDDVWSAMRFRPAGEPHPTPAKKAAAKKPPARRR